MFPRLPKYILLLPLLVFVACSQEEATQTPAPATATPQPTATLPEPTDTAIPPTAMPATDTPEPTGTSEPEEDDAEETASDAAEAAGYWEGVISTSGIEISIAVEFNETDDGLTGTIDIPDQGAVGVPLENITYDGENIHFEIAAVDLVFDGTIAAEIIAGDFAQGAATGTFEVTAAERVEEEAAEPEVDLPYSVEEITWDIGDTIVAATLTLPEGDGPFPAVIMIAGSGPTDRDWNSPLLPGTNGSAALFADALTRAGYATLRYDKRVSGPNLASNVVKMIGEISLESHLEEVASGVAQLADHEQVDANRIFALANSEGTVHAMNYQRQESDRPLAGIILAAPPGRTMEDLMRSQIEAQVLELEDGEAIMALYDEAVERFMAGEPVEPSPDLPNGIQQLLLGFGSPANLPFTKEIFTVDPTEWLKEIKAPVLVLIGKKDIQVDWEADGGRMEEAAEGMDNVIFVYPENADHVFKYLETPIDEVSVADAVKYNAAGRVLDGEALAAIIGWLADK